MVAAAREIEGLTDLRSREGRRCVSALPGCAAEARLPACALQRGRRVTEQPEIHLVFQQAQTRDFATTGSSTSLRPARAPCRPPFAGGIDHDFSNDPENSSEGSAANGSVTRVEEDGAVEVGDADRAGRALDAAVAEVPPEMPHALSLVQFGFHLPRHRGEPDDVGVSVRRLLLATGSRGGSRRSWKLCGGKVVVCEAARHCR
jgi:hypothetical protein